MKIMWLLFFCYANYIKQGGNSMKYKAWLNIWLNNYIKPSSKQRTFELLLKKLKIPHKGFHSLRHTFATRALECGMDVKSLSEILGHKNATITLNRYAHSLWEHILT